MINDDILREYSKELYRDVLHVPMSLLDLIASHRYLRSMAVDSNMYRLQCRDEGYKIGYALGMEQVNREWIKIADLKEMSMQEVANILYEEEEEE